MCWVLNQIIKTQLIGYSRKFWDFQKREEDIEGFHGLFFSFIPLNKVLFLISLNSRMIFSYSFIVCVNEITPHRLKSHLMV